MGGLGTKTKTEYLYDFLTVLQGHLGVELEPEPVGWKDQYNKDKQARKKFLKKLEEENFKPLVVGAGVIDLVWADLAGEEN